MPNRSTAASTKANEKIGANQIFVDFQAVEWELSTAPPRGNAHYFHRCDVCPQPLRAALTAAEKRIYLVGGCDPVSGKPLQQVLECDIAAAPQWHRIMDMPQALSDAVAVVAGAQLFVFGGMCNASLNPYLYALETASPAALWRRLMPTGTYAERPCPVPSARIGHAMVEAVYREEPVVYLFGGHDGARYLNDIWRLRVRETVESQEAVWEMVEVAEGPCPSPREAASLCYSQAHDALFVFGGSGLFYSSEFHMLDLQDGANRWVCLPTVGAPSPRRGALALVHKSRLLLLGGEDERCAPLPELCALDLATMQCHIALLGKQQLEYLQGGAAGTGWASPQMKMFFLFGGAEENVLLLASLEESEQASAKKK